MAECRYQKQSYNPLTDSTRFSDVSASLAMRKLLSFNSKNPFYQRI